MNFLTDDTDISILHLNHPQLRAQDWRSPLVFRLLQSSKYQDSRRNVSDSFRGTDYIVTNNSQDLHWSGLRDDFEKVIKTYQEPILTEYAALGLACMLIHSRLRMQLTEVTRRGDKVDYWLGDKELLLEVGGRHECDLDSFCEEKAQDQLLQNPYERDGYVFVAEFQRARAKLWFYKYE
jgi:hypothetical protein